MCYYFRQLFVNRSIFIFACLLAVFVLGCFQWYWWPDFQPQPYGPGQSEASFIRTASELESDYRDLACRFARLDPFDPSILEFVTHPRSIDCKRVQAYDMTYIDDQGFIRVNQSEWKRASADLKKTFACECRTLDRHLGRSDNDNEVIYGPVEIVELESPLKMNGDVVEVRCQHDPDQIFYRNLHVHPSSCAKRQFKNLDDAPEDQLSVFMILIDSVSLSALKRNLPSTYKYLTQVMGFHVFNGFTKVGDNSRPNLFPILFGKRLQKEQDDMPSEIDNPNRFLDDDGPELIWKRFANLHNYSTMMNEDFSAYGVFHYGSRGYRHKPADFYYHSFWNAASDMSKKLNSSHNCIGNIPMVQMQLDITRKHIELFNNKLQFIYAFFAELSHSVDSAIEKADTRFLDFFQRINNPDLINRSVIIFMSDHGHRFSRVRQTLVRLIEERQPMFSIRFPPWFYEKYPRIEESLRWNTMRLTAPFDVHETLLDILHRKFNGSQRSWNSRCLSMLYPIPKNRTCTLAGIPEHFCTCIDNQQFDPQNRLSQDAAEFLEAHLNNITSNTTFNQLGTECESWNVSNVVRAERVGVSRKVKEYVINFNWQDPKEINTKQLKNKDKGQQLNVGEKLRVAARMEPNWALFEAEMQYNGANGNWTVIGEISRLNEYGNQSWCVQHEIMRKYCVCKVT